MRKSEQLLSKKQRHSLYLIVLAAFELDPDKWSGWGMCHLINDLTNLHDNGFHAEDGYGGYFGDIIDLHLPELKAKRPVQGWPSRNEQGWKARKKWLRECIEETA